MFFTIIKLILESYSLKTPTEPHKGISYLKRWVFLLRQFNNMKIKGAKLCVSVDILSMKVVFHELLVLPDQFCIIL